MPKYRVLLTTVASLDVLVEAENEEEARDKAFEHDHYICAHCSGWGKEHSFDLGEWDLGEDEGDVTEV